jgi:cytochrome c
VERTCDDGIRLGSGLKNVKTYTVGLICRYSNRAFVVKTTSTVALIAIAATSAFHASQGSASATMPAPPAFAQCQGCHAISSTPRTGIGPNLFGVANRRAGGQPNFNYSQAMARSKIVWTRANLMKFITNPQQTVPGTRMQVSGVKDPAKAKTITDYLMQAK